MSNLYCTGLRKHFGDFAALDGVSIEFPPSGIWALVGANGAGKTTLLNILTGHARTDDGHCYLGKEEVTHLAPYRIARLGITRSFQRVRLFWGMSALDNILSAFPDPRRRRREKFFTGVLGQDGGKSDIWNAHQLLNWVQLTECADVLARNLSYGQQKLLALMCCVATGARVFLLDEPVAGLDQTNARQILKLLVQLREAENMVVFIEHDLQAVQDVAEFVIVLSHGRVLRAGAPAAVLSEPVVVENLIG
jgi:branched-chain amino acid transport system ATP-binding protein